MIKKIVVTLIALFFIGACEQKSKPSELKVILQSLSEEELSTLDVFFRTLLSKSQGGYVLYGDKPLCLEAFAFREGESIYLADWVHVFSTELKKGALLWQKLGLERYCKNHHLHITDTPTNEWQDLLLINKKAITACIEKNHPLFQYVLGPRVSPKNFLEDLLDSHRTFDSVVHGDRVLIGILLGYGTQNALFCSRDENIQDNLYSEPSYGFQTLEEESAWLKHRSYISIESDNDQSPRLPWFGCYDVQESAQLIAKYQKTQKKIAKVLKSPHFLEDILSHLFEEKISLKTYRSPSMPALPQKQDLTEVVAQGIWHSISEKDPEYIEFFIQGLYDSEKDMPILSEDQFCNLRVRYLTTLKTDPDYKNIRNEIAYSAGLRVWNHFKLGRDFYSLPEVLRALKKLQSQSPNTPLDAQTDKILTNLHWYLYVRKHS